MNKKVFIFNCLSLFSSTSVLMAAPGSVGSGPIKASSVQNPPAPGTAEKPQSSTSEPDVTTDSSLNNQLSTNIGVGLAGVAAGASIGTGATLVIKPILDAKAKKLKQNEEFASLKAEFSDKKAKINYFFDIIFPDNDILGNENPLLPFFSERDQENLYSLRSYTDHYSEDENYYSEMMKVSNSLRKNVIVSSYKNLNNRYSQILKMLENPDSGWIYKMNEARAKKAIADLPILNSVISSEDHIKNVEKRLEEIQEMKVRSKNFGEDFLRKLEQYEKWGHEQLRRKETVIHDLIEASIQSQFQKEPGLEFKNLLQNFAFKLHSEEEFKPPFTFKELHEEYKNIIDSRHEENVEKLGKHLESHSDAIINEPIPETMHRGRAYSASFDRTKLQQSIKEESNKPAPVEPKEIHDGFATPLREEKIKEVPKERKRSASLSRLETPKAEVRFKD